MNTSTTVTLSGPGLAPGRQLDITVTVSATIEVDAVTAQRRAAAWLVTDLGNLLPGDSPALVIGQRPVWRVPVLLTSPSRGVIGPVGSVDVDAQSGEVLAGPQLTRDLLANARQLAHTAPPPGE